MKIWRCFSVVNRNRNGEITMVQKIACVGSHGVGKSTYCYRLASMFKRQGGNVHIVQERVRFSPFPINQGMTIETAIWASTTQISKELEAAQRGFNCIICDRSAYDTFIYAEYFHLQRPDLLAAEKMAKQWLTTYDQFYWIRPNMEVMADGVRSTDTKFVEGVDALFAEYVYPLIESKTKVLYTSDIFAEVFA